MASSRKTVSRSPAGPKSSQRTLPRTIASDPQLRPGRLAPGVRRVERAHGGVEQGEVAGRGREHDPGGEALQGNVEVAGFDDVAGAVEDRHAAERRDGAGWSVNA